MFKNAIQTLVVPVEAALHPTAKRGWHAMFASRWQFSLGYRVPHPYNLLSRETHVSLRTFPKTQQDGPKIISRRRLGSLPFSFPHAPATRANPLDRASPKPHAKGSPTRTKAFKSQTVPKPTVPKPSSSSYSSADAEPRTRPPRCGAIHSEAIPTASSRHVGVEAIVHRRLQRRCGGV